mgnify:CR=1 FL=1
MLCVLCVCVCVCVFVFFQAEDGIRDLVRSRGLGDVYKRQVDDLLVGGVDVGDTLAQHRHGEGFPLVVEHRHLALEVGRVPDGVPPLRFHEGWVDAVGAVPDLSLIHI